MINEDELLKDMQLLTDDVNQLIADKKKLIEDKYTIKLGVQDSVIGGTIQRNRFIQFVAFTK